MSTLIVAAILVGIIGAICLVLVFVDKKQKHKRKNRLLQHFSGLASKHNLTFSSQVLLKNTAIGLDGVHRKLLALTVTDDQKFDHQLMDLNHIQTCTVKKIQGTIAGNPIQKRKQEQYLERIILYCELKEQHQPYEILFFNHLHDPLYEAILLEQKAKEWELMIAQMLSRPVKKMA
jgi:hypothetical protein